MLFFSEKKICVMGSKKMDQLNEMSGQCLGKNVQNTFLSSYFFFLFYTPLPKSYKKQRVIMPIMKSKKASKGIQTSPHTSACSSAPLAPVTVSISLYKQSLVSQEIAWLLENSWATYSKVDLTLSLNREKAGLRIVSFSISQACASKHVGA